MFSNATEFFTGIAIIIYGLYQIFIFLKSKIKIPIHKQVDFLSHSFFKVMADSLEYTIPNLEIKGDPQKSDVTRIYASAKVRIFRDEVLKIVYAFRKGKGEHCFSEKDLLVAFDKTVRLYRKQAVKELTKKYNKRVAELFDDKFTNEIHYACITTTKNCISSICKSRFYLTCSEKLSAILDVFTFAFQHTIIDLERTCSSLNGELTKEFEKLGYVVNKKEYVTKDEFEMSEKVQNIMIKKLNKGTLDEKNTSS